MSNRVGPHYSSFNAMHGMRCIPSCDNEVTHWECLERFGYKHYACQTRCDAHKGEPDDRTTFRPLES